MESTMNLTGVGSVQSILRRHVATVAWRGGQAICGLCCLAAVLVLVQPPFGKAEQICIAALILLGAASLIAGRMIGLLAVRRRRRRVNVY
jgi:hypothetical protein